MERYLLLQLLQQSSTLYLCAQLDQGVQQNEVCDLQLRHSVADFKHSIRLQ